MKKSKVSIHWASGMKKAEGNAYGYYVHNEMLKKYTSEIANITEEAKNALFIISPEFFHGGIEGKKNFLFTMFEGNTLPEKYREPISKADIILTPSNWVREIFLKYFPEDKVFVVNHGVEKDFTFKKRKYPIGKPFRFLWVGAHNPRKGWEEISYIWQMAGWNKLKNVELYLKTTTTNKLERFGNVIFDSRNLSKKELIDLYHSSHCFVFPTRGEGFGLTLAESMATGLPCISPKVTGVADFFDEKVGYKVGYKKGKGTVKFIGDGTEVETEIVYPHVDEISETMKYIMIHYDEAAHKGELASKRIKSKFTWQRAAQELARIIKENGYAD